MSSGQVTMPLHVCQHVFSVLLLSVVGSRSCEWITLDSHIIVAFRVPGFVDYRFAKTISACLQIDERVASDTLRLVGMMLVVVFEGRAALPRTKFRPPAEGEQTHRAIVEAIRNKDTDAVIDAVEQGQVDVNHTDDVGQTLLNWASAFG